MVVKKGTKDKHMSVELEVNELRSLLARQSADAAERERTMKAIIEGLEMQLATRPDKSDPGEEARALILRTVASANSGKPGHMSMARIGEACNMSKSKVHTHAIRLEKEGKVWIRKTHDPESGRPCAMVHHAQDPWRPGKS